MRLILKMMIPFTALALAIACGDDSKDDDVGDDTTDNGDDTDDTDDEGTGGTGGGEPGPSCKGAYYLWNASQLEAATTTGDCKEDTAEVCARDLTTEAGEAGVNCFMMHTDDPQALGACVLDELKKAEMSPSDPCLTCYVVSVACVQQNCLEECLSEPNGQVCLGCRLEKGCTTGFLDCSGLPSPLQAPN
jgi:hypothetical protein